MKYILLTSSLLIFTYSLLITTPSLVEIMVLSLFIESDNDIICFSNHISKYALIATGKPTLAIKLISSLISIILPPKIIITLNIYPVTNTFYIIKILFLLLYIFFNITIYIFISYFLIRCFKLMSLI